MSETQTRTDLVETLTVLLEAAHEDWCEEDENRDPWSYDAYYAMALAICECP